MLEVFELLIFCSVFAIFYEKCCYRVNYQNEKGNNIYRISGKGGNIIFFILAIVMIIFSGTRTIMNDTVIYLAKFSEVPSSLLAIKEIDFNVGSNPLFMIYRILIKSLVSENGQVFIFITACLVIGSYLLFLKKYAFDFGYTVFILIGFTVYAFTMAAIKQTMAIAIAIWVIPDVISKKKIRPIILLVSAIMIHPYVIIYFAAFFLSKGIWDKKTLLLLGATLAAGALFSTIIPSILNITSSIGDNYEIEWFTDSSVSTMRLAVYMIVPGLSFFARRNINVYADRFTIISINLSIVSSCFMIMASFGGANMFGRMANYMDIFQCMALPAVLYYGYKDKGLRSLLIAGSIIGYILFYYTYYSKYTAVGSCFYGHVSFLELLRNW